jgi:hypothetical protein
VNATCIAKVILFELRYLIERIYRSISDLTYIFYRCYFSYALQTWFMIPTQLTINVIPAEH